MAPLDIQNDDELIARRLAFEPMTGFDNRPAASYCTEADLDYLERRFQLPLPPFFRKVMLAASGFEINFKGVHPAGGPGFQLFHPIEIGRGDSPEATTTAADWSRHFGGKPIPERDIYYSQAMEHEPTPQRAVYYEEIFADYGLACPIGRLLHISSVDSAETFLQYGDDLTDEPAVLHVAEAGGTIERWPNLQALFRGERSREWHERTASWEVTRWPGEA